MKERKGMDRKGNEGTDRTEMKEKKGKNRNEMRGKKRKGRGRMEKKWRRKQRKESRCEWKWTKEMNKLAELRMLLLFWTGVGLVKWWRHQNMAS